MVCPSPFLLRRFQECEKWEPKLVSLDRPAARFSSVDLGAPDLDTSFLGDRMKSVLLLAALFITSLSHALYKNGDMVGNYCWKDSKDKSHCLKDDAGKTRILMFSAGWCMPCRQEFAELAKHNIRQKGIVHYSLSCEGNKSASIPSPEFLNGWDKAYNLSPRGIKVLSSPRDCAKDFDGGGMIPSVAVIGPDGRLREFAVAPGVNWILTR